MQGRKEDNIADNGFIKQRSVRIILDHCREFLQSTSKYSALHLRIPVCIGYSTDLTPIEFELFIEQIQAIVHRLNNPGGVDQSSFAFDEDQFEASDNLYDYTFYLYPNEHDQGKVSEWLKLNSKSIEALYQSKHLVDLRTVRSTQEWQYAKLKYEKFIESSDKDKKMPLLPDRKDEDSDAPFFEPLKESRLTSELLELDAKGFLKRLKDHGKADGKADGIKLSELVKIAKEKIIDVLSWGIKEGSVGQKPSMVLHYASPPKAMSRDLLYLEHMGFVARSSMYQEFKKNKIIKRGVSLTMPLTSISGDPQSSNAARPSSKPMQVPVSASPMSSESGSTNSTDTSDDEARAANAALNTDLMLDLFVGLKKRGMDSGTAAEGATILEQEVRKRSGGPAHERAHERGRPVSRTLTQSGAKSAPSSPPNEGESLELVRAGRASSQSPTLVKGTMFGARAKLEVPPPARPAPVEAKKTSSSF